MGNLDNPGYIHLTDEAKRELGYVPRVCYTPGLIPRVLQLVVPGGPVIYVEMKHLFKPETWYDPKKFALKVTEDNEYAHYDVSAETGIEGLVDPFMVASELTNFAHAFISGEMSQKEFGVPTYFISLNVGNDYRMLSLATNITCVRNPVNDSKVTDKFYKAKPSRKRGNSHDEDPKGWPGRKLHEPDALYMNVLGMFDVMNMVGEVGYFEPQEPVDSRHGKIHTELTMLQLAQYYVNTHSLAIGRTEFTLNSLMGEFKAEELEKVLCESTGQGRMDPDTIEMVRRRKTSIRTFRQ